MSTIAKRLNIYLTAFDPPTQNNLKSSQKVQIINFRKFNFTDDKAIDDRIKIFSEGYPSRLRSSLTVTLKSFIKIFVKKTK